MMRPYNGILATMAGYDEPRKWKLLDYWQICEISSTRTFWYTCLFLLSTLSWSEISSIVRLAEINIIGIHEPCRTGRDEFIRDTVTTWWLEGWVRRGNCGRRCLGNALIVVVKRFVTPSSMMRHIPLGLMLGQFLGQMLVTFASLSSKTILVLTGQID